MKQKKGKARKPSGDLVSSRKVQNLLGIAERTLHRYVEMGMPVARRGRGRRLSFFDLSSVQKWIAEKDLLGDGRAPAADAGEISPAMERWREERYREAKRKNDVADGRLLEKEVVQELGQGIFTALRTELEAVGRSGGPVIADLIRDAIERAEKAWEDKVGVPEPAPPAEPAVTPAAAAPGAAQEAASP